LDVAAVNAAITDAQKAIEVARAAVAEQAGKVYEMTVKDDDTLGGSVHATSEALRTDLTKIHELLQAAREAVRKAATALAQIPRVDDDASVSTTTPSSTN
jgi:hypothetical protein